MSAQAPTYAFHGLDVRDKLLLKSMIERAARRSSRSWRLSLAVLGDCVFYQGERPRALRPETVAVHLGEPRHEPGALSLSYPPRLQDVVALLAALERRLALSGAPEPRQSSSWHALLAVIQQHIARGERIALVDARGQGWAIHPRERQYTACGDSERAPTELAGSSPDHWQLVAVAAPNGHPRRALESLLWQLGIEAGGEGVLASIGVDRPMRLRTWPYLLARAPKRFGEFAALLRQAARSAQEMQRAAAAGSGEVAGFYNACALCGFLAPAELSPLAATRVQAGEPPAPRPAQRFSRFLGAIRHALGMPA